MKNDSLYDARPDLIRSLLRATALLIIALSENEISKDAVDEFTKSTARSKIECE